MNSRIPQHKHLKARNLKTSFAAEILFHGGYQKNKKKKRDNHLK